MSASASFTDLSGKRALITGGLGMIGSTIARRLVEHGAEVTLLDACADETGASFFNVADIRDKIQIDIADIRDRAAVTWAVKNKDIIFNLAAQVSHNDSMVDPFHDTEINYVGHLTFLEALREHNPEAVVLHTGSRLQYGRVESCPISEEHPLRPRTPYALNKTAAENMYQFYYEMHGIPCVLTRLANPYGPRSQMRHSKYSMVNWFVRQAMEDKPIRVYGDGSQIRDYVFVDDVADALIIAVLDERARGAVLNVGSGAGTSFGDMARMVVDAVGRGAVEHVPWPDDYVNVETGDYFLDIQRIQTLTNWKPHTDLAIGIQRTAEYYEEHRERYWTTEADEHTA